MDRRDFLKAAAAGAAAMAASPDTVFGSSVVTERYAAPLSRIRHSMSDIAQLDNTDDQHAALARLVESSEVEEVADALHKDAHLQELYDAAEEELHTSLHDITEMEREDVAPQSGFIAPPSFLYKEDAVVAAVVFGMSGIGAKLLNKAPNQKLDRERNMMLICLREEESNVIPQYNEGSFVNQFHDIDHAQLHNIGIAHDWKHFYNNRDYILLSQAIRTADVALLEYGRGYFDALADYAQEKGKKAFYVDIAHSVDAYKALEITAFTMSTFLALYAQKHEDRLARIALAIPISLYSKYGAIADVSLNYKFNIPERFFLSHVADGRTVLMLKNSLDVMDAMQRGNHGEKVSLITGNVHARGIEDYLAHPKTFALKKYLWNIFGGNALIKPTPAY